MSYALGLNATCCRAVIVKDRELFLLAFALTLYLLIRIEQIPFYAALPRVHIHSTFIHPTGKLVLV